MSFTDRMYAVAMDRFYEGKDANKVSEFLGAVVDTIAEFVGTLHCRIRGHDLEDVSTAGPDSGNVSLRCKRCSFGYHQTLY